MARRRNLIQLIIDRVGNVNIFNLIKEDEIPVTGDFKTVVDDDLIMEYIDAVNKLYQVFLAETAGEKQTETRLEELKELSHEFYKQLLPVSLQNYFHKTKGKFIYLKPDNATSKIPWELLYDGDSFFSERFYIGRGAKCNFAPKYKASLSMPVKMLIIIDPTGTLAWSDFEAENLKTQLRERFTDAELSIESISNKELSKLKLMNAMRDKDIIHFIGHSVEDEADLENSGWKIGKNKLLKVREIEKSNISPVLVFSHSCRSAGSIAKAFSKAGVRHFVGCRHDVLESAHVIEFVSRFYNGVLTGVPAGKAFADAMHKNQFSGLLSFNYVLFSNPKLPIQTFETGVSRKSFVKPEEAIKNYPYPIAEYYRKFLVAHKKDKNKECMEFLSKTLFQILRFFSYFIITDLKRHSLFNKELYKNLLNPDITAWKNFLYAGLSELINLRQDMELPLIANVFYLQKENIEKSMDWIYKFHADEIPDEELPELIVVFHYIIDSILIDLSFITRFDLLLFEDDGLDAIYQVIDLKGVELKQKQREIHEIFQKGQVILFDPIESITISELTPFIKPSQDEKEIAVNFMNSYTKNKKTFDKI